MNKLPYCTALCFKWIQTQNTCYRTEGSCLYSIWQSHLGCVSQQNGWAMSHLYKLSQFTLHCYTCAPKQKSKKRPKWKRPWQVRTLTVSSFLDSTCVIRSTQVNNVNECKTNHRWVKDYLNKSTTKAFNWNKYIIIIIFLTCGRVCVSRENKCVSDSIYYSPVALQTLCFQTETRNQDEPLQWKQMESFIWFDREIFALTMRKSTLPKLCVLTCSHMIHCLEELWWVCVSSTQTVVHAIDHSLLM